VEVNESISPHRRLAVTDGAIMVAATAIGLSWYRSVDQDVITAQLSGVLPRTSRTGEVVMTLLTDIGFCWPMAFVWSIAGLMLRLRRPRPGLRLLMRQPGFIASCAVAVVAAFLLLPFLIVGFLKGPMLGFTPWDHLTFDDGNPTAVGLSVTTAWVVAALGGNWRAERGWIDRIGRVLGT